MAVPDTRVNRHHDPQFPGCLGKWEHPYQIADGSPCIDAGTLANLPDFIQLPETDLAGNPRIVGDSIDMGAGDDTVSIMATGIEGTPTIANLDLAKLDGGAGNDTLKFEESGSNTTELTLTTGGSTNFENIIGTGGAETIKGDANANKLEGKGANDTLYGYAGNDTLEGDGGNDTLYGGNDNDTLKGEAGDDTLDGGTGTDTLTGGNGTDTFVIRSGDGSTIADANVITDFTDGTDVIGMENIVYDDLTIAQGSGTYASHTLVSATATGEYLLIIQNATASNITAADFSNTSTEAQTLNGTSGNNILIGGAGNDTFNGGAGSDELYGYGGNDTFNNWTWCTSTAPHENRKVNRCCTHSS